MIAAYISCNYLQQFVAVSGVMPFKSGTSCQHVMLHSMIDINLMIKPVTKRHGVSEQTDHQAPLPNLRLVGDQSANSWVLSYKLTVTECPT